MPEDIERRRARQRRYQSEYYQANKEFVKAQARERRKANGLVLRAFVKKYLQDNPCVDCGYDDWRALEFDHTGDDKTDAIANLLRLDVSLARLKHEIRKCDVRCANCHRIITFQRAGSWRCT